MYTSSSTTETLSAKKSHGTIGGCGKTLWWRCVVQRPRNIIWQRSRHISHVNRFQIATRWRRPFRKCQSACSPDLFFFFAVVIYVTWSTFSKVLRPKRVSPEDDDDDDNCKTKKIATEIGWVVRSVTHTHTHTRLFAAGFWLTNGRKSENRNKINVRFRGNQTPKSSM